MKNKKPHHPGSKNLVSWVKGQSGNPKGRVKGSKNIATALRERLELQSKDKEWTTPLADKLINMGIENGNVRAIVEIMDRIEGKAESNVNLNHSGSIGLNIEEGEELTLPQLSVLESMPINRIVLVAVAARIKINPDALLFHLESSFYSSHNGFQELKKHNSIIYPSVVAYNWDNIKNKHQSLVANEEKTSKVVDITPLQKEEATKMSEKLKESATKRFNLKDRIIAKKAAKVTPPKAKRASQDITEKKKPAKRELRGNIRNKKKE